MKPTFEWEQTSPDRDIFERLDREYTLKLTPEAIDALEEIAVQHKAAQAERGEEVPPISLAATPGEAFQGHRRAWAAVVVLLASLLFSGVVQAAEPASTKAPRVKPVSTITVKVVSDADYQRKAKGADPTVMQNGKPAPWIITALDTDSCTAWVSTKAPDVTVAELLAFRACRTAINKAVDAAHAEAEKGGRQ